MSEQHRTPEEHLEAVLQSNKPGHYTAVGIAEQAMMHAGINPPYRNEVLIAKAQQLIDNDPRTQSE